MWHKEVDASSVAVAYGILIVIHTLLEFNMYKLSHLFFIQISDNGLSVIDVRMPCHREAQAQRTSHEDWHIPFLTSIDVDPHNNNILLLASLKGYAFIS